MSALYQLRFFLDGGSGVCLWSQTDAARDRFGYSVDLDDLNLPPVLVADLERLMADFDATIDWNDPGRRDEPDLAVISFGYEPGAPFRDRIQPLVARLRSALGPDFAIATDYEG